MTQRLTRTQLFELVWAHPISSLAAQLHLSDVAIAKRCRQLEIPLPGRGHWAKVQAGLDVSRPPLPQLEAEPAYIEFPCDPPAECDEDSDARARIAAFAPSIDKVEVSSKLTRPHLITAQTKDAVKSHVPDMYGHVNSGWSQGFVLSVHPTSIDRALLIIDALVKSAESFGVHFRHEKDRGELRAYLGEGYATLKLRERSKQHVLTAAEIAEEKKTNRYFYQTRKYSPTGILRIEITSWLGFGFKSAWEDGKTKLEVQLHEVVRAIFQSVMATRILSERREAERRRWEAIEERRRQAAERQRKEDEAWRALRAEAVEWRESEIVRSYLAAVQSAADLSDRTREWLTAAEELLAKRAPIVRRT
jgi:hypothetical protein